MPLHASSFSRNPTKYAKQIISFVFVAGLIASAAWALIYGIANHQRGIYGGVHYDDGLSKATQMLNARFGTDVTNRMRMGTPTVTNTHLLGAANAQVRVYHFVGARGVKYCVSIWGDRGSYGNITASKSFPYVREPEGVPDLGGIAAGCTF